MFASIKDYFYIVIGFIVMGFVAVFKYRGMKIDSQAEEIEGLEAEGKKQDFETTDRVNKAIAEAKDADDIYPDGDYRL